MAGQMERVSNLVYRVCGGLKLELKLKMKFETERLILLILSQVEPRLPTKQGKVLNELG